MYLCCVKSLRADARRAWKTRDLNRLAETVEAVAEATGASLAQVLLYQLHGALLEMMYEVLVDKMTDHDKELVVERLVYLENQRLLREGR